MIRPPIAVIVPTPPRSTVSCTMACAAPAVRTATSSSPMFVTEK